MKPQNVTIVGDCWTTDVWDLYGSNPTYFAPRRFGTATHWNIDDNIESYNTPGFKKLKRRQLPDHPHYWQQKRTLYNRSVGTAFYYNTNGKVDRSVYDCPASAFSMFVGDDFGKWPGVDPRNMAIAKLQSSVNLSQGSLAVGLAEANKTAAHLAHTATRLVNAYRALRKGRLGDFASELGIAVPLKKIRGFGNQTRIQRAKGSDMRQFASSTWLEYSYGWKPLLSDFYAQAENFAEILIERQYVIREAKASKRIRTVYVASNVSGDGLWKSQNIIEIINGASYTVRYRIRDGAHNVGNVFGMMNPLQVAWEVVPFSFVADWFLPIGSFLENLSAYNGLEFAGGTLTQTRSVENTGKLVPGPGSVQSGKRLECGGINGSGRFSAYGKTRSLLSSFPSQSFPQFKDPRSFAHAASAIALLQSVFLGSRKNSVSR